MPIAELLKLADQVDQAEDEQFGAGRRGDELPEDLRRAQSRLARIRQTEEQLEAQVQQQAQAFVNERPEKGENRVRASGHGASRRPGGVLRGLVPSESPWLERAMSRPVVAVTTGRARARGRRRRRWGST